MTLLLAVSVAAPAAHAQPYEPTEQSLAKHQAPAWYRDAKLGIFVHWGLYSVPGYATREAKEYGSDDLAHQKIFNPYSEWYLNTLRIADSPTARFHRNAYGADFDYYDFARTFKTASQSWNPGQWADLFANVGARYVVLTTKHHDGFALWPSAVTNPRLDPARSHSDRDLVGELTMAVRARSMRMGFYYSGLLDWSFSSSPITGEKIARDQSPEYIRYADAQWRELIARYNPDIVWNDIGYSPKSDLLRIAADYYNKRPDGVLNNRWSPFRLGDFTTPEYAKLADISPTPWEMCRGLGKSFGLNRVEGEDETITPTALVHLLIDVVSKNGNLLLDVGPEPDGTIPAIQVDRLEQLGAWLKQNGEAIFATRPWVRASSRTGDGIDLRFTRKGDTLYAILLGRPAGATIDLPDMPADTPLRAHLLGTSAPLTTSRVGQSIRVRLPKDLPGKYAWVIRLG